MTNSLRTLVPCDIAAGGVALSTSLEPGVVAAPSSSCDDTDTASASLKGRTPLGLQRDLASDDDAVPVDITFVIAAYNVAPFIAEAVNSALAQDDCRVEVLVIDDASTDDTALIVDGFCQRDRRVRLIRTSRSGGAAAARNLGFERASGEWVAVLDGDDVILPGRGRAMLNAGSATSADIIADNLTRFGPGVLRGATAIPIGSSPYGVVIDAASYLGANQILRRGRNLGYLKPMFRRNFMMRCGLRYDETLRIGEDSHLCLAALLSQARFLVISEPFYQYRVRAGSLSWRLNRADVEAMAAAFVPLRPIIETLSLEASTAARSYARALERARSIVVVVEAAKAGYLRSAVQAAWRRPDIWSYLGAVAFGLLGQLLTGQRRRLRSAS